MLIYALHFTVVIVPEYFCAIFFNHDKQIAASRDTGTPRCYLGNAGDGIVQMATLGFVSRLLCGHCHVDYPLLVLLTTKTSPFPEIYKHVVTVAARHFRPLE